MNQIDKTFPQNESRALLMGLTAVACWSTVATAFKLALATMNPQNLLFVATLSSTLVIGLVLLAQGNLGRALKTLPQEFSKSLGLGLLNPLAYYYVLFSAYDLLPAQVAQPINYTWAIVLAVMAVPVLGQKLSKNDIMAMLAGYAGVVIIALGGGINDQPLSLMGVGLALFSTVIWASYWLLNSKDIRDPVVGLFQNFFVVLPITCVFAIPVTVSFPAVLSAVYAGIFEMGITFVMWLYALKYTRHTSRIGNLIFISPFVSLVFIYLVLEEPFRLHTIFGLLLILFALKVQNSKS